MPEQPLHTYTGLRDFMPGECGPAGEAARVFTEADKQPNAATQSLAKQACHNCLQLPYCTNQQKDIANTLQTRGATEVIVGAAAVQYNDDLRYLTQRERLAHEPQFLFNVTRLPEDPAHTALLLRQHARTHPKSIAARPSQTAIALTATLLQEGLLEDHSALTESDAQQVLYPLIKLLTTHARQNASESTWRRRPIEAQLDIALLRDLAPLYLTEAAAVKDLGLEKLSLVIYHDADFWRRLLEAYQTSQCISLKGIKSYCRKNSSNPIPAIERHINRTVQKREGTYHNPYKIPADIRKAEISRLTDELKTTHSYITPTMLTKIFNSCSTVERAHGRIEKLRQPEVMSAVIEYKYKVPNMVLEYFLLHSDDPCEAIEDYFYRTKVFTTRLKNANYHFAPSEIEAYALHAALNTPAEKIAVAINSIQLKRDFRQKCRDYKSKTHIPGWAFEKIVEHYPQDEWWEVATNLNELLETGVLKESFLTCALETEAADVEGFMEYALGSKGAYLTFTVDALMQYDDQAQAALVKQARLDLLIYGHEQPDSPVEHPALPIWLKPEEKEQLALLIKRGEKAARILSGELPVPKNILMHFGWPANTKAKTEALSAIRHSVIRAKNAMRVQRAAVRRRR